MSILRKCRTIYMAMIEIPCSTFICCFFAVEIWLLRFAFSCLAFCVRKAEKKRQWKARKFVSPGTAHVIQIQLKAWSFQKPANDFAKQYFQKSKFTCIRTVATLVQVYLAKNHLTFFDSEMLFPKEKYLKAYFDCVISKIP